MSRFCYPFSFFVLDSILDRNPNSLGTGRLFTVHNGDPGEFGTNNDVTFSTFGVNYLTMGTVAFDNFATYDTASDEFYILNTDNLESIETATSYKVITWLTIWDDSLAPIPIVRASFNTPYFVIAGNPLQLLAGQLRITVRNTGQNVADAILRCVWADSTFSLMLGNFELGLFSSISGINTSNEITRTTPNLNRIRVDKTLFVPNSVPKYSYARSATWGIATTAGTSNAFALLDNANNLISYQLQTFSWTANTPIGIQAYNFFLGVD